MIPGPVQSDIRCRNGTDGGLSLRSPWTGHNVLGTAATTSLSGLFHAAQKLSHRVDENAGRKLSGFFSFAAPVVPGLILLSLFCVCIVSGQAGLSGPSVEKAAGSTPGVPGTEVLNEEGEALLSLGNYSAALGYFNQAVAADPGDTRARVNRGTALLSMGNVPEALLCFDIVLDQDPGNTQAWIFRGDALSAMGKDDDARKSYQMAGELEPGNPLVKVRLGRVRERDSLTVPGGIFLVFLGAALVPLSLALLFVLPAKMRRRQTSPVGIDGKATPGLEPGQPGTADSGENPESVLITQSPGRRFFSILARLFRRKVPVTENRGSGPDGDTTRTGNMTPVQMPGNGAVSGPGDGMKYDPERRAQIIHGFDRIFAGACIDPSGFRGISHYAMGNYREAHLAFAEENRVDRGNPRISAFQALSHLRLGQTEEALKTCETAILGGSGTYEVQKIRCIILHRLGRWDEALRACDEALSLRPSSVELCSLKARVLHGLRRYREALRSCEFALGIDPASEELLRQRAGIVADLGGAGDAGEFSGPVSGKGREGFRRNKRGDSSDGVTW